jgi:hypothetical protein
MEIVEKLEFSFHQKPESRNGLEKEEIIKFPLLLLEVEGRE